MIYREISMRLTELVSCALQIQIMWLIFKFVLLLFCYLYDCFLFYISFCDNVKSERVDIVDYNSCSSWYYDCNNIMF